MSGFIWGMIAGFMISVLLFRFALPFVQNLISMKKTNAQIKIKTLSTSEASVKGFESDKGSIKEIVAASALMSMLGFAIVVGSYVTEKYPAFTFANTIYTRYGYMGLFVALISVIAYLTVILLILSYLIDDKFQSNEDESTEPSS